MFVCRQADFLSGEEIFDSYYWSERYDSNWRSFGAIPRCRCALNVIKQSEIGVVVFVCREVDYVNLVERQTLICTTDSDGPIAIV